LVDFAFFKGLTLPPGGKLDVDDYKTIDPYLLDFDHP
jgi:hypothetical protein